MLDFQKELNSKIDAGIPIIQIISYEWRRILGFCVTTAKREGNKRVVYWWNKAWGIRKWDEIDKTLKPHESKDSVVEVLKWYNETMEPKSILIIEDIHVFYEAQKSLLIGPIRIASRNPVETKKTLILAQPIKNLPAELEKDVYVIEIPLPGVDILSTIIDEGMREIAKTGLELKITKDDKESLAKCALGLTEIEAKYTFKEIALENKRLTKSEIPLIIQRKEQIIKKSGILEYIHPKNNMNDVGGMEKLKEWLDLQQNGFESNASDFGIEAPKGVLLLGVPGCGKSLIAQAVGTLWELPLLKFDLGKVFGGIVGESESNMRKALTIASAIAPCVLWIDEIEKGLSGVSSSDKLDSGVTARVFGTLLTWMQEKSEPVFVVATANNISEIPAEFLRKGRFNDIFFVDLPGPKGRKAIWEIHLRKRLKSRYNEVHLDLDQLVDKSKYYSGSEIEESVNMGLLKAYNLNRELQINDIIDSLKEIYPLSQTMSETIRKLRKWAEVRVRIASNENPEDLPESKEETPRLKQEMMNIPFV